MFDVVSFRSGVNGEQTVSFFLRISIFGFALLWGVPAMAQMSCPLPPTQIEKDVYSDGKAKLGSMGPIHTGDFEGKLEIIANDFMHTYPNADKFGISQLFLSVTCEIIKNSSALTYEQKEHMLETTRNDIIRVFFGGSASQTPTPPQSPKWLTAALLVPGCGNSGCDANHDVCQNIDDGWYATAKTRNWYDSFGGAYGDWIGDVRFEETRVCRTFHQHSHNVQRNVSFQFEVAPK